jgi:hypothetical protein
MSWFKNIITGGNYDKLQDELDDLEQLREFATELSKVYSDLEFKQNSATRIIKEERADAIKNINMAKSLIKRIKANTKSKTKQELVQDFNLEIEVSEIDYNNSNLNVNFDENLNAFAESVFTTLDSSLSNSFEKLEQKNDYSRESLKEEALNVGIDLAVTAVSKGITELINANQQTNTKRRETKEQLEATHNYIIHLYDVIPDITAFIKRIIEVSRVLNKNNQVFTTKYREIHDSLFENISIKTFLNDKIICNKEEDMKKIMNLMKICSNYNNVNKNTRIEQYA